MVVERKKIEKKIKRGPFFVKKGVFSNIAIIYHPIELKLQPLSAYTPAKILYKRKIIIQQRRAATNCRATARPRFS